MRWPSCAAGFILVFWIAPEERGKLTLMGRWKGRGEKNRVIRVLEL